VDAFASRLILKRNCSMSPAGLAMAFAALAAVTLAIGVGFALVGAWLVLPFAGLEVLMLGAAFFVYARRAGAEVTMETTARLMGE
jgi:uncharacterized membrane protein